LKYLPFDIGIKVPIYIGSKVKIDIDKKSHIQIIGKVNRGQIRINITNGSVGVKSDNKSLICLKEDSRLIFQGKSSFFKGSIIKGLDCGVISIGDGVTFNKNAFITCRKKITIGRDCMFGWNCNIRDCDGHDIFDSNQLINPDKEIEFGKHIWCCANCSILKGTKIPDGTVIAYGSLVNKKFEDKCCIIGGHPARILKQNIKWIN